jgi:hypothetical protein
VWGLIYHIILGGYLFTHRGIATYIPNLRICVKMYVVPQHFLNTGPRSIIVFQQEWMMISASEIHMGTSLLHLCPASTLHSSINSYLCFNIEIICQY